MEHKTTDQQFNESYAKRGVQPSVGVRPTIRNKKVTYKGEGQESALVYEQSKKQTLNNSGVRRVKKRIKNKSEEDYVGTAGEVVQRGGKDKQARRSFIARKNKKNKQGETTTKKKVVKKKVKKIKKVIDVNKFFYSFFLGTVWWLQLILGLLSAVFLTAALAISNFSKTVVVASDAGFLEKVSNWALNTLKTTVTTLFDAFSTVSEFLFGFNFYDALDPSVWFAVTYVLLLAIFIVQLFIMYFVYKLSRIEPLLGSGAGLKLGTFLLCFVLYCVPVLNIFPWFILWTLGVFAATAKE